MWRKLGQVYEPIWLVLITIPGYLVIGWSLVSWQRLDEIFPLIVSAAICLLFATLALIVQDSRLKSGRGIDGTMLSILLRTFCPMLIGLTMPFLFWHLPERQIFEAFVGCYLLTLFVETLLSVRLIKRRTEPD